MEGIAHEPWLPGAFNWVFGNVALWLAGLFGVELNHHRPIPDHVAMALIVAVLLVGFSWAMRNRYRLIPGPGQQVIELIVDFFRGLLLDVVGEKGAKYLPVVGTLGLFILASNLIGLIPTCASPTANLNVTVACAVTIFIYYHASGIREQGILHYLKHFAGPIPALAPIVVPIEIISHFSRIVSLSVRLFGNIFGEDLVILILFSLVPLFVPLPMQFMALFTGVVQTFVFVMLSCIYIGGAIAAEEEDGHQEAHSH
ncbi:MAG: F0F1 ATP synthase subunit A [Acidobacteriota bacterium]